MASLAARLMASLAAPLSRYSHEAAVARTAVKLGSKMCTAAQLQLQELVRQQSGTEKLIATTALGCQAILALVLQQGLSEQSLRFVAARNFDLLRAPITAESIKQAVNEVLSGEPGYRAATDAEFEDLLWAGFSHSGAEGRYWVINPIDGVEGFEKLRQYGISLALLDNGKVVLAALACPNLPLEPILATTQTVGADGRPLKRHKQTVTTPSSVSKPLEQSVAGSKTGCLFTAVQDQGAFQAALFADDGEAQGHQIKLPIRPFFPPGKVPLGIVDSYLCQWKRDYTDQQTFALVSPHECKFQSPGDPHLERNSRPTVLSLDGQAQYGVLGRGDAKVLLTGGQDDIWDHAAGMLIAQESGLRVTNGAGAALDTSCGTKLNCDSGVLATHPLMHADVIKHILSTLAFTNHQQWVSAIIDSGAACSASLHMAAENYECANYHEFVGQLREAGDKSRRKLSVQRAQHLASICCEGPAAVQLAVAQQSISCAEVEAMLQVSPEAARNLSSRSLGCKEAEARTHTDFMVESSNDKCWHCIDDE